MKQIIKVEYDTPTGDLLLIHNDKVALRRHVGGYTNSDVDALLKDFLGRKTKAAEYKPGVTDMLHDLEAMVDNPDACVREQRIVRLAVRVMHELWEHVVRINQRHGVVDMQKEPTDHICRLPLSVNSDH